MSYYDDVFAAAIQAPLSPKDEADFDSVPGRQLLQLCRGLQRSVGTDGAFALSFAAAERLLGIDRRMAYSFINRMTFEGRMTVVEKGSRSERRATRYRFLLPIHTKPEAE